MRALFHPRPVNGAFGDPALYVELLRERGALMFDLGDIAALPPRKVLRLGHVFVSHAHMDHFGGMDRLVRLFLGRAGRVHLYGPPGFLDRVEHRLAGYTWNLVHHYDDDFTLVTTELHGDEGVRAEFHTRHAFAREAEQGLAVKDAVILDAPAFRVRYTTLDHGIPSLAFCAEEKRHVNVLKERLAERELPVGPWLRALKALVLADAPDDTPVEVPHGPPRPLADLRGATRLMPGQRIAYVVDCAGHEANATRIVELARDADTLFMETTFLDADAGEAHRKQHLTARRAGEIARRAGVRRLVPVHFSTRYEGREDELRAEAAAAFEAGARVEVRGAR